MVCSDEYGLSAALMAIKNNELMRDLLYLDGIQRWTTPSFASILNTLLNTLPTTRDFCVHLRVS
jgi:hypothetical protein